MVRFKNRYLLCYIETDGANASYLLNQDSRDISHLVRSSLQRNFGDHAYGELISSLSVKLWSPALSLCLIRCARDHYRTLWAAITLITSLSQKDTHPPPNVDLIDSNPTSPTPTIRFTVIHIGGTIRSCQKSAIDHARQLILRARESDRMDSDQLQNASIVVQRQMQRDDD